MKKILLILLGLSILTANIKDVEFKTSGNFPNYDELQGDLDKSIKKFLDKGTNFNTLDKRVVKFTLDSF